MELEISKNVLNDIAASTLERIEGLEVAAAPSRSAAIHSLNVGDLPLSRRPRALKITRDGQSISVDVGVTIEYGRNLLTLSQQAQHALAENIELMTGLKVRAVNVTVQGVSLPANTAGSASGSSQ